MSAAAVIAGTADVVMPALAALPFDVPLLSPDDVKGDSPLPQHFVELRVSGRFGEGESQRASHTSERRGFRITLVAASAYESNLAVIYDAFDAALRDHFISVDGRDVLVKYETTDDTTDNAGRSEAASSYTTTL